VYNLNGHDIVDQVQALLPDARTVFEELRPVIGSCPGRRVETAPETAHGGSANETDIDVEGAIGTQRATVPSE
jgi:hypothetical protein